MMFAALSLPHWAMLLLVGLALFGSGTVTGLRLEEDHRDAKEAKQVQATLQAEVAQAAKSAAQTKALQQRKDDAITLATQRAAVASAAASAARAAGDSLRNDLASQQRVSDASLTSLRLYAATLQTVFGECTRQFESMARAADGHASDSLMLQQAWPKQGDSQ